ncbi:MAG: hypothetical protein KC493_01860 [Bacteriovoracaceae bacterium]|nr:hypothetical protein [Bacteriovoracaceae bacterium]
MNELFDKLILRIVFTIFMLFLLYLYKYAHSFLYPSSRQQLFKRFFPIKNSPDTMILVSRILGIGLLFSQFYFFMSEGFLYALLDFFLEASIGFMIYLTSIYILESIVLFNFEYQDEVLKRKNYAYSIISMAHSIGFAYILKVVLAVSNHSVIMLFFLWLFAIVLIGFATKSFGIISKLPFNRLLVQKNLGLAFSYLGFFWGWTLIISSSINNELIDIRWFSIQVILKIVLSLIIIPIFRKGLLIIFKFHDEIEKEIVIDNKPENQEKTLGYGIYEGSIFFASCFLTTVITGHINFGTFYPVF